jgi:23S rRNA (cytosine1962-C5)-methyltransferase
MCSHGRVLPCLLFEDDHLLVVNKPAGLNTHAPHPYAGEGLYDWLRHREARWAKLAIIQRLDKETSGVIVFSKSTLANRSLTEQFTTHTIRKKYLLLTDRPVPPGEIKVESTMVRAGERYVSRPLHAGGERAETRFRECRMQNAECRTTGCYCMVEAEPLTGRTHQIRVQAAEKGFPILGDTLYGGTSARRVYLHAAELTLRHPASGEELTFRAPFGQAPVSTAPAEPAETGDGLRWLMSPLPCLALREALIEPQETNAYRVIHGASDGWPAFEGAERGHPARFAHRLTTPVRREISAVQSGQDVRAPGVASGCTPWYVERLGDYLLSQSEQALQPEQCEELARLAKAFSARGTYHKVLTRHVRRAAPTEASPQLVLGDAAPERFTICENGVQFELSFTEGYSVGLFLDQRDNRQRLLTGHVAAGFPLLASSPQSPIADRQLQILNTFAYTCGFSVCAAKAGAQTTSLDLSKKCLDWGKRNFALNQLDPAGHDFIYGDAFDWLRRLAKKQRLYDVILLDPPTFSQSKGSGVFRADKDYGRLVTAALPLLRKCGVLFASTNAADWAPEEFLAAVAEAIRGAKRQIVQQHYVPQPPDFPISRAEPAYLKTVWVRVE